MPLICMSRYCRGKWRHCARYFVTKKIDDAECNSVLAMVVEHLEHITRTWDVILTVLADNGHSIVTCGK